MSTHRISRQCLLNPAALAMSAARAFAIQFIEVSSPFIAVGEDELDWGDYDNDGDLDAVLVGDASSVWQLNLNRNHGGTLVSVNANLEPLDEVQMEISNLLCGAKRRPAAWLGACRVIRTR